jgi:hypothetical protein
LDDFSAGVASEENPLLNITNCDIRLGISEAVRFCSGLHVKISVFLASASIATALTLAGSAARADIFDFSYTGDGFSGSGDFTTGVVGSPYQIIAISGIANGEAITGLSSYAGSDNQLFFPGPLYADFGGISFSTVSASYNLTDFTGSMSILTSTNDPGGSGGNSVPIDISVSREVGSVPEPASWAMMLIGFGGLGALLRRRRGQVALTA